MLHSGLKSEKKYRLPIVQKLKSTFFEKRSDMSSAEKFQNVDFLDFELIVQPHIQAIFLTFFPIFSPLYMLDNQDVCCLCRFVLTGGD